MDKKYKKQVKRLNPEYSLYFFDVRTVLKNSREDKLYDKLIKKGYVKEYSPEKSDRPCMLKYPKTVGIEKIEPLEVILVKSKSPTPQFFLWIQKNYWNILMIISILSVPFISYCLNKVL